MASPRWREPRRAHRTRHWLVGWLLAGALLPGRGLCGQTAERLVLWVTPTDAEYYGDGVAAPGLSEQAEFFDDFRSVLARDGLDVWPGIELADVRLKARQDPDFARRVLGQRMLFRELSAFAEERGLNTPILVRFFDWEELLDVLDYLPEAGALERPHVVGVPATWTARLADRGVLAPLGQLDTAGYLPEALESARAPVDWANRFRRMNGSEGAGLELFALPWAVDLRFLYYWKDRLGPGPFPDRNTFRSALATSARGQLESGGDFVPPIAFPSATDWELLHSFSLLVWGAGGEWMDSWWDFIPTAASSEALGFLQELAGAGEATFPRVTRAELEDRFLEERIGSVVAGPWMIRRLRDRLGPGWPEHVGIQLPPFNAASIEPSTMIGGFHLGVTPEGLGHPSAVPIVEHLTTGGASRAAGELLQLPGSREGLGAFVASVPEAPALDSLFESALDRSRRYPRIPEWAEVMERGATRLELPLLYKHVGEFDGDPLDGNSLDTDLARRDLAAWQARAAREIYTGPRLLFLLLAMLVVGIVGVIVFVLFFYPRILKRQRAEFEHQLAAMEARIRELSEQAEEDEDWRQGLRETLAAQTPLAGQPPLGAEPAAQPGDAQRPKAEGNDAGREPRDASLGGRANLLDHLPSILQELQELRDGELSRLEKEAANTRASLEAIDKKLEILDRVTLKSEPTVRKGPAALTVVLETPGAPCRIPPEEGKKPSQQRTLLNHLVRLSLGKGGSVPYSAADGYLLFENWGPGKNPGTRQAWELVVNKVRDMVHEDRAPKANGPDGYRFDFKNATALMPSDRGDLDYQVEVVDRLAQAKRLHAEAKDEEAIELARQAFDAQALLEFRDLDVCLLLSRWQAGRGALDDDVREALRRHRQRYEKLTDRDLQRLVWETWALGADASAFDGDTFPDGLPTDLAEGWNVLLARLDDVEKELRRHSTPHGNPAPAALPTNVVDISPPTTGEGVPTGLTDTVAELRKKFARDREQANDVPEGPGELLELLSHDTRLLEKLERIHSEVRARLTAGGATPTTLDPSRVARALFLALADPAEESAPPPDIDPALVDRVREIVDEIARGDGPIAAP